MRKLFIKQFQIMKSRGWDKIFIFVDIHDTILNANYQKERPTTFFPGAKEVLQRLTARKDVCLILYTCSYPDEIVEYQKFFKENGIIFTYVNENPEAPNTDFGCFDKKPYINILLDDKAGFDAEEDWHIINYALDEIELLTEIPTLKAIIGLK